MSEALHRAITGIHMFFEDNEKRRALIRSLCEEIGVREGDAFTPEQKKLFIEKLADRITKGERIYGDD